MKLDEYNVIQMMYKYWIFNTLNIYYNGFVFLMNSQVLLFYGSIENINLSELINYLDQQSDVGSWTIKQHACNKL